MLVNESDYLYLPGLARAGNIRGGICAGIAGFPRQTEAAGGAKRQNRGEIQTLGNDGQDQGDVLVGIGKRKETQVAETGQSRRLVSGGHTTDQRSLWNDWSQ